MRKLLYLCILFLATTITYSCKNTTGTTTDEVLDTTTVESVADTALYGTIGEGTTMHVLELKTDDGKTLTLALRQASAAAVPGGIFSGAKISVVTSPAADGGQQIDKLVNITSLLGRWTAIDRSFEICEDGVVHSNAQAESHPYTQWKLCNTNLILNTDTFAILLIGPDSLSLENNDGIFVYKRQR